MFFVLNFLFALFILVGASPSTISAYAAAKNDHSSISNFVNQTLRDKKSCRTFFKGQIIGRQILIPTNHYFSNSKFGIKRLNTIAEKKCNTHLICNLEVVLDVNDGPGGKVTLQSPIRVSLMPDHKTIKDCMCSFTNYTYCER